MSTSDDSSDDDRVRDLSLLADLSVDEGASATEGVLVRSRECVSPRQDQSNTGSCERRGGDDAATAAGEEPALASQEPRPPPILLRVHSETRARPTPYRQSRADLFLDPRYDHLGGNADFEPAPRPRSYDVRVRDDGGDERRRGRRRVSCARSLDNLDRLEPEAEWVRWRSEKSLHGMSSEEDLRQDLPGASSPVEDGFPITTESDAESTGDELERVLPRQTLEQAFGAVELVAGLEVPTCKCTSKETCHHRTYWKGELTETWHLRLFQDEGGEREITLPSENNMSLSQTTMEKVCKMTPVSTVFDDPL